MSDFFISSSDNDNQDFIDDEFLNPFLIDNQDNQNSFPFCTFFENKEEMKQTDNKDSNNQINHDLKHDMNVKKKSRKKPKPYHKRKSTLSYQAQYFRDMFYMVFTKKKKFPKTIIWEIHKRIQEPLHLLDIDRGIIRDNDKYFETFSNESLNIIHHLQRNKDQIISLIPDLQKYALK